MVRAKFLLIMAIMFSSLISGCPMPQELAETGKSSREPTQSKTPVIPAAGADRRSEPFDFNRHVGWIHGACLGVKIADLHPGTVVHVISLENPQSALKTSIIDGATPDSGCPALLPDRLKVNQSKHRSFYTLDLPKGANFLAVGVVGVEAKLTLINGTIQIDLNQDGKAAIAGSCQTSEGIRFYLVPSDPSEKVRLWSDYYYLGYDTKPTCSE